MPLADAFVRSGKVRDLFAVDDDRLLLVASDRMSAFDVILPTEIPDKGRILTGLSRSWFAETAGDRAEPPALDRSGRRPGRLVRHRVAGPGFRPRQPRCDRHGPGSPARPDDALPPRRGPAGRGHRPRLPRGQWLEGLPGATVPSAGSDCRRVCARATGCPSRSSRPRRRRSWAATTRTSTSRRWPAIVGNGARRARARRRPAPLRVRRGRDRARRDPAGRHEVRVRRLGGHRRAAAHRRGPDAGFVALLGRGDLRAGSRPGQLRQAVPARLAGDARTGTRPRPDRTCRPRSSPASATATSKPTSGSPAPASSAISRRTSSPDESLPVRHQRHAEGRHPRPAGPRRRGQPRSPRHHRRERGPRRPTGRADRGRRRRDDRPRHRRSPGRGTAVEPAHRGVCRRAARRDSSPRSPRPPGPTDMPVRDRGRRLPGQQLRPRHGPRALDRRRRAGRAVARAGHPRGRRRGRPARWLRVRRLRPGRRHRPIQPGDAGRRRRSRPTAGSSWASATGSRSLPRPASSRGALLRNRSLRFAGRQVAIAALRDDTPFTRGVPRRDAAADAGRPRRGLLLRGRGDAGRSSSATARSCSATSTTPDARPDRRTRAIPNGSLRAIAGVLNAAGNVAGLMPHPERAAEAILGSDDGMGIIRSLVESAAAAAHARRPSDWWAPDDARRGGGRHGAAPSTAGRDRRRARGDQGPSGRARPQRPRTRDVQRHVERALLVQELEAAAADAPDRRRGRRRRSGRERRRHLDRWRPRGRVQDRVAQPSVGGGAVPGRRDRRRRHPARHLHDGRPPDRGPRRAPLRRPERRADPSPRRRRSSAASAATAIASACRRSAASSSSTRATRATRSSTSWPSA